VFGWLSGSGSGSTPAGRAAPSADWRSGLAADRPVLWPGLAGANGATRHGGARRWAKVPIEGAAQSSMPFLGESPAL